MTDRLTPIIAALFLTAATATTAAQQDPGNIDPRATEIAMNAAKFLSEQSKMSFGWFISYDEVVDGQEKITYLRSGTTVLERGKGFVFRTENGNTLRDFYFDGSEFSVASPNENFYASKSFEGGFDALAKAARERSESILPVWSILSRNLPDNLLKNVENSAYLGATLIAGRSAYHLAFSEAEEDWQVWISTDEEAPLPLMLIGTERNKPGWPQYRIYFSDWNLDPDPSTLQFTYEPEEDDVRISFPAVAGKSE